MQLELFPQEIDYEIKYNELYENMTKLQDEWERTRKSQYAKIADLRKMYQELAHEFQMMQLNICKGRIAI